MRKPPRMLKDESNVLRFDVRSQLLCATGSSLLVIFSMFCLTSDLLFYAVCMLKH